MTDPLPIDVETVRAFIGSLVDDLTAPLCWQTFDDAKQGRDLVRIWFGSLDEALPELERLNAAGAGIFVTVNETTGGRAADDVTALRACFIDVDGTRPLPTAWPLAPSIVTKRDDTHWHAYWLLDEALDVERFRAVQKRLIGYWGSDIAIHDPSRVMRVPGFWHRKAEPLPVTLELSAPARVYSFADLETAHPVVEQEAPAFSPRHAPTLNIPAPHSDGNTLPMYRGWAMKHHAEPGQRHRTCTDLMIEGCARGFSPAEVFAVANEWCATVGIAERGDAAALVPWVYARAGQWRANLPPAPAAVDLSALIVSLDPGQPAEKITNPGPFPAHLLMVPGVLGLLTDYIDRTAIRRQPVLALAAALPAFGALVGRKVSTAMGGRSNLYSIGVGRSGRGKNNAFDAIMRVFQAAGIIDLIGPSDWASDTGILSALQKSPSILFMIDEIGQILASITNERSGTHLKKIVTVLMTLYSKASSVYKGKAYADSDKVLEINQPNVCLYGATVPGNFYTALQGDSLTNGFLARLMVFVIGNERPPRQLPERAEPPTVLLEALKTWAIDAARTGNLAAANPDPRLVEMTPEAVAVFDRLEVLANVEEDALGDDALATLWTRVSQRADQLALLYACSRSYDHPVIDGAAADWAAQLSVYLARSMAWECRRHVAENAVEATAKRVLRVIEDAGMAGVTASDLARSLRSIRARERKEIVDDLLANREVFAYVVGDGKNPGPKRMVYKSSRFVSLRVVESVAQ